MKRNSYLDRYKKKKADKETGPPPILLLEDLFEPGLTVWTPGARELLDEAGNPAFEAFFLLRRHLVGDWGDLDDHDKKANDEAVLTGGRILSAYTLGDKRIWLITEADRSATTFLLPEEY